MFLKTLRNLRHTLALRLTLWYGGIFAASSVLAFAFVYAFMVSVVQQQTDDELEDDVEEFVEFMQVGGLDRVRAEIIAETQDKEAEQSYIRLWADNTRQLMASDLAEWPELLSRALSWPNSTTAMSRYYKPCRCRNASTR
ncbi:MAG: hypothetical protein HC808_02970 [Candidatus Competibacteraceae bacterium]|nr:hypothetical protein [Candidatus Competibacteraceae bacterium]